MRLTENGNEVVMERGIIGNIILFIRDVRASRREFNNDLNSSITFLM